jgi:hypothetical protein
MAAPNIESSSNPQTVTGGEMGAIVGYSPLTTVGFYGEVGNVQQTILPAAGNASTTQDLVNSVRTILLDLGIVKA